MIKQFLRAGCGTRPSREGRAEGGVRSGPLLIVYRGCVWRRPGPQSLYEAHTAAIGFMVSHGEPSDRRFTKDICYRAASKNLLTPVVQPRVACLGDSLTRGDGRHETGKSHGPSARVIAGRGNYPLALARMARNWTVANFGRGGSTVSQSSSCNRTSGSYAKASLYNQAVRWKADIYVVMLGVQP